MPLRWRYETWRKLYVREEGSFAALPLFARALARELLALCDGEGRIHLGGREPYRAIAMVGGARGQGEWRLIRTHLNQLIADGYIHLAGDCLVIRNFLPAQEGHDRVPAGPRGPARPVDNSPVDNSHGGARVARDERESSARVARDERETSASSAQVSANTLGTDVAPFRILPSLPSIRKKRRVAGDAATGAAPGGVSEQAVRLANHLLAAIRTHHPSIKGPAAAWAREIDLALRIDRRDPLQLQSLIDFAHCSPDTFWRAHILSGKKLREKFDTLAVQAQRPNGKRSSNPDAQGWKDIADKLEATERKPT